MVRTGRLFPLRLAASAVAALLFALAIVLLFLPSAPEAELTLGPARRNSRTVTEDLERALMNSPTHRANILEPIFQDAAIGESRDGDGIAFAQIFRAPRS